MHGRRVFAFSKFPFGSDWPLAASGGAHMEVVPAEIFLSFFPDT